MDLNKFPKQRIKMPKPYQEIYLRNLKINREGKTKITSFSSRLESWLHKKVANDIKNLNQNQHFCPTLEIGAGTLNHLKYEPQIQPYDIIEPCKELYEGAEVLSRIRNIYTDISNIKRSKQYKRIISIATFEHILNLSEVVARSCNLLADQGCLRVAIPNEGTILWKLGTRITGLEFKNNYGLDYQVLMSFEHVNTAQEIEEVLTYFFKKIKCKVFGLSKSLALYRFYSCSEPKRELADQYLLSNELVASKGVLEK